MIKFLSEAVKLKKDKKLKTKHSKIRRLYKIGKFIIFIINSASAITGAVSVIKKVLSFIASKKHK